MSDEENSAYGDNNSGIVINGKNQDCKGSIDITVQHVDSRSVPVQPAPWYFEYLRAFAKWSSRGLVALFSTAGLAESAVAVAGKGSIIQTTVSVFVEQPGEAPATVLCEACDQGPPVVEQPIYRIEARCTDQGLSRRVNRHTFDSLVQSCPMQSLDWDDLDRRFFGGGAISSRRVEDQLGVPEAWTLRNVRAYAVSWPVDDDFFCAQVFERIIQTAYGDRIGGRCETPQDYRLIEAVAVRPLQTSEGG